MPDNNHNHNDHHRPGRYNPPVVYVRSVQACRPVYNNQATLDALNAILAGCTKLSSQGGLKCDDKFIKNVEQELLRQLSLAVYVGQNCSQPTLY